MKWIKLATNYYTDPKIIAAGEAAELLFLRILAYCGDQESDGFVPSAMIPRLISRRGAARVQALVDTGLLEQVSGGYRVVAWSRWGHDRVEIEQRRASAAERVRKHRHAQKAQSNAVTNAVSNAPRTEEKRSNAAAAALQTAAAAAPDWASDTSETPEPAHLPDDLVILKTALDARKLTVRWDRLTSDHITRISHLIALHGDQRLVQAALNAYRPDAPPAFAQAWLGTWEALPEPGHHLKVVDTPCPEHPTIGTTRHCLACITDTRAAN